MNENYMKMCREAVEIQESWEPKPGDYFYSEYSDEDKKWVKENWTHRKDPNGMLAHVSDSLDFMDSNNGMATRGYKEKCEWLPRQEDLQDLCANEVTRGAEGLIRKIASFTEQNHVIPMFSRSEQITAQWLRYAMQLLFNKKWDSIEEKWVPI